MTITLQALSLVENEEPVQVRVTLRLRDQRSMCMQGGCKSLHGFLHGIQWIMFHGHLDYFLKPPLGGRPHTKPGDHGTKRLQPLVYSISPCVMRIRMNRNPLK